MYKAQTFLNSMSETVSRINFLLYNSNNKTFLSNFDIVDDLSAFHKY